MVGINSASDFCFPGSSKISVLVVGDEDMAGDAASVARCDIDITGDEVSAGALGDRSAC